MLIYLAAAGVITVNYMCIVKPIMGSNLLIIAALGDSITEGVMIDDETGKGIEWLRRPYQDNSTATYAWLTAEYLGLKPIIMGYGGVGVTKEGCSCVPRAQDAYPFCYHNAPISYANPNYIVINHGTNDRGKDSAVFRTAIGICSM